MRYEVSFQFSLTFKWYTSTYKDFKVTPEVLILGHQKTKKKIIRM